MVGTSGKIGERFGLSTASTFSLPLCACGFTSRAFIASSGSWPPMTSVIACAPPRYGTCCSEMPAARSNSSIARCGVEPLPGDANDSAFGLALAAAISCATLPNGAAGLAAITTGTRPTMATGTRSRSASNGGGWYSAMFAASAFAASNSVEPSGGASITDLTAMLVPAPGLFSTITGWPTLVDSACPSVRATMSTAPPAE